MWCEVQAGFNKRAGAALGFIPINRRALSTDGREDRYER
jgi:hypothetical protein